MDGISGSSAKAFKVHMPGTSRVHSTGWPAIRAHNPRFIALGKSMLSVPRKFTYVGFMEAAIVRTLKLAYVANSKS